MSFKYGLANVVGHAATWGLQHVFKRPAQMMPGKLALRIDPDYIVHSRIKIQTSSLMVLGTNGKTTVNNMIADALVRAGHSIVCNRTGANMATGVSSALLQSGPIEYGVIEADELWAPVIASELKPRMFVLNNLFRDQLDRMGEIDRTQEAIIKAVSKVPDALLVYNADDPMCAQVARQVPNTSLAFGIAEDLHLVQNSIADAQMCQSCSSMLTYDWRIYGSLGSYHCSHCDFARPELDISARAVALDAQGVSFDLYTTKDTCSPVRIHAPFAASYMIYNLLAVLAATQVLGLDINTVQEAISAFDPKNGRLQAFDFNGRQVLCNLAKNPTGFNQNLRIVTSDHAPKAVAFFINDETADGHDVSWLWDIDFEELSQAAGSHIFCGGTRAHDMQVRLKYANITSEVVADADELLNRIAQLPAHLDAYIIANYTSLPGVRAALNAHAKPISAAERAQHVTPHTLEATTAGEKHDPAQAAGPHVRIAHLYPELLNLYGDGGNVRILEQRLAWRNIPYETTRISAGDAVNLEDFDLIMMGGSPDLEQKRASAYLVKLRDELAAYIENGGPALAVCGSYQMLGHEWLLNGESVPGLGILDMVTRRPGTSADRLTDNIVISSPAFTQPIIGFENHAGRTYLANELTPFGNIVGSVGVGNNEDDKADGVIYKNLIGTYLHGPLLSKNPEVADWLLERALTHMARRTHTDKFALDLLDDSEERAAADHMFKRLGIEA